VDKADLILELRRRLEHYEILAENARSNGLDDVLCYWAGKISAITEVLALLTPDRQRGQTNDLPDRIIEKSGG
jgi:hypothetical protein